MVDFNSQNKSMEEQDEVIFAENVKLNSRLVNLTILETVCIVVMAGV